MSESKRRGSELFRWARAATFFTVTALALIRMPFYPPALALALAAGLGALGLLSPGAAVAAFVVVAGLPLIAANAVTGIAFVVVGLAAVQYLGGDGAQPFAVVGLAFVATALKLEWGVVALAGYVLGVSEGAVAALVACAAIEVAGVLLGVPSLGATAAGGHTGVLALERAPEGSLAFTWLIPAIKGMSPQQTLAAFRGVPVPALLIQPLVWAAGAGASQALGRKASKARAGRVPLAAGAGALGAAVVAIGSMALLGLGSPVDASSIVSATIGSAIVAAVGAAVFEGFFPKLPPESAVPTAATGVQAEDADVDELLRLIASAEEELATRHTADSVVMITDMKSFSAMTEEDGSVASAKRIQRHRDLLIPIIAGHGGHGKSTGGDGLVAAFGDAGEALSAAVEMQQALDSFNADHANERAILIRIGLAQGEVVLDNGGRPFIGSALNKAARVMNLADGGQILASTDVVARAGRRSPEVSSRGSFELKNIPGEVEVAEILWSALPDRKVAGA